MSLDVYLIGDRKPEQRAGIYIREDGQLKEISRDEWDFRFPGQTPVVLNVPDYGDSEPLYQRNITHNLNKMADAAGIYEHLWRPDEIGVTRAAQLIGPLTDGLGRLRADPGKFQEFNPPNKWGDYGGLVAFVADYLEACRANPDAQVRVSR